MTNHTAQTHTTKVRRLPLLVLGIIIFAVAIALSLNWINQLEARKPRVPKKTLPLVEIEPVMLSANQATLSAGGFVSAKFNSNITAEVSGTVLSVAEDFAVGQSVQKGQILATIDNRNYVAALATAKSNLATANSNYAQEQAQSEQAGRDAARFGTKASDLTLRKPQLAAAKAAVENAQAQLVLAKINLDKTKIKAPFDALIQARNIAPADSITASTAVAQLLSTEVFTVKLTVSGDVVDLLAVGNQVELQDSNTEQTYQATISRFDPSLNNSTRTAGVYVDIQQPLQGQQPLLLNSYLTATIVGKTIADSMWIDNKSIVKNKFVWIKREDDTLSQAPLHIFYRGEQQSLVQFQQVISGFIAKPKDSFFEGEQVTTKQKSIPQDRPSRSDGKRSKKANQASKHRG